MDFDLDSEIEQIIEILENIKKGDNVDGYKEQILDKMTEYMRSKDQNSTNKDD